MGCFFGCFRIKDDKFHSQPHLVAEHVPSKKTREDVKSQNRLSSLLLSEEREDTLCKDEESHGLGSPQPYIVDRELKDEAKFLKACGAILETPTEIRKAAEKLKGSPPHPGYSEPSTFHSWLPNTSIKKLQLDKQPDQSPTPSKICEDGGNGSYSLKHSPSSCISNSQNTGMMSTDESGQVSGTSMRFHDNESDNTATPVSLWSSATNLQRRNKSVRFDCANDEALLSSRSSSSGSVSQNWNKLESSGNHGMPKPSPYSTPLELTDEMQTPGTVFPANLKYTQNMKNARIRSQYVYSALNPIDNFSQWNELKEEDSNLHKLSGNLVESLDKSVDESNVDASLTSCLKPAPFIRDGNIPSLEVISRGNPYFGRTPGDRPILGTVAAHWNGDEPYISPKMWDGNGIPNSTNKYKEDQKVSWHATPFEERLEKALSEESSVSQRKNFYGTPMALDDNEENDTAASHLQSLTHPKSVISF